MMPHDSEPDRPDSTPSSPAASLLQRAGGGFGLIGLAGLLQQEGLLERRAAAERPAASR